MEIKNQEKLDILSIQLEKSYSGLNKKNEEIIEFQKEIIEELKNKNKKLLEQNEIIEEAFKMFINTYCGNKGCRNLDCYSSCKECNSDNNECYYCPQFYK